MKHIILAAVLAALLTTVAWFWWIQSQVVPAVLQNPDTVIELPPLEPQTYISDEGVVVTVVPDAITNSLLLMSEVGGEISLEAVLGTDGTQFESAENMLVATLTSDTLTLARAGQLSFVGRLLNEANDGNVLAGSGWYWQELQLISGERVTAREPERFKLTFNADNTLSVGTDCNQQGGPYEVNNNNLLIGSFYATKMYCEGAQESVYVGALQKVVSYAMQGATLSLQQADGSVLTFSRAAVAE